MPLYKVPAIGSREEAQGVRPDFPDDVVPGAWTGAYDDDSHSYVIRTEHPIEGLDELAEGEDVGFDYSNLVESSPEAEEVGQEL